ncbi:MAG: type II toxin-antitoxin system VapC family toxin [Gammaproteobacteria bacterium]|jgi:tRNA(fMet)-specific endonuclease VapC|nr:type II toxin-antitoxin system VapC family toxin [Gammaproteobacteria bacterium]MBT6042163.1 type II toxin-antitoxin system VapC family toxin [Gammaproteobacteria bacterium]
MIIMLSSDLCRLVIRDQPTALLGRLQEWSVNGDEVVISAITYAELIAGALLTQNQSSHIALVEAFCERLEDVVPWNRDAVDSYTTIQLQAMRDGKSLNMNDAMVAAHALSLSARLLTHNGKPFVAIPELDLEIWQ